MDSNDICKMKNALYAAGHNGDKVYGVEVSDLVTALCRLLAYEEAVTDFKETLKETL